MEYYETKTKVITLTNHAFRKLTIQQTSQNWKQIHAAQIKQGKVYTSMCTFVSVFVEPIAQCSKTKASKQIKCEFTCDTPGKSSLINCTSQSHTIKMKIL